MKNTLFTFLILSSTLFLFSCKKEKDAVDIKSSDAEIIAFTPLEHASDVIIDNTYNHVSVSFTSDIISAENFTYEYILSEGARAEVDGIEITSGLSPHDFDAPFYIGIKAEDEFTLKTWKIIPDNNAVDLSWGLGGFQKQEEANNHDYDWYLDQATTGAYSSINCGPTSTTMAAMWSNESFSLTPADAREAYRPDGGWWYTSDIHNYLTDVGVNHFFTPLTNNNTGTETVLKNIIDEGNIAILCLDMYYIRSSGSLSYHVDKFYNTSAPEWGHFIVVKGYKEVDKQYFFEVYDPYSYHKEYSDGSLKGKDRYYRSQDLYSATSLWWNYAIIVTPSGSKSLPAYALDPATIPEARGK